MQAGGVEWRKTVKESKFESKKKKKTVSFGIEL